MSDIDVLICTCAHREFSLVVIVEWIPHSLFQTSTALYDITRKNTTRCVAMFHFASISACMYTYVYTGQNTPCCLILIPHLAKMFFYFLGVVVIWSPSPCVKPVYCTTTVHWFFPFKLLLHFVTVMFTTTNDKVYQKQEILFPTCRHHTFPS